MTTDKRQELEEQLLVTTEPEKCAEILCSLVDLLHRNETDQALDYARKALACAEQSGSEHWISMSCYAVAVAHISVRNKEEGLIYAKRAQTLFENMGNMAMVYQCRVRIAICYSKAQKYATINLLKECATFFQTTNDKFWEGYTLMLIGATYRECSDYVSALQYLLAALEVSQEIDDKVNMGMCYNNISFVYCDKGYLQEAYTFACKYRDTMQQLGDKRGKMFALNLLGSISASNKQFQDAFMYLGEAEKLAEQYTYYQAEVCRNFVGVYLKMGEWEQAIAYGHKALQYCADGRNPHLIPLLYQQIGAAYSHGYNPIPGKEYLMKALEYAKTGDNLVMQQNCYRGLTYVFQDLGDQEELIRCYEELLEVKEKLHSEDKLRITSEMQTKFDVENTEREKELFRVRNVELSAALEEVRQLNDRLTQLNQEKNEVLSIVAHDLKSPLSGIKMVSSLLKEHYNRLPKEDLYHQLDTIEQTSDRMLNIATSLLKAQTLENEGLYQRAEQVEVVSLVASILERYRDVAQQKSIFPSLNTSVGEHFVSCNRGGLEQVVENVVDNAIKFTPHGKTIAVDIQVKQRNTIIEVCDEGPGISRKDRTRLFGKFARLSAQPTGGESSTGLGLWIAKKTIETMQGTIRYRSKPDGGAKFCISIPHFST